MSHTPGPWESELNERSTAFHVRTSSNRDGLGRLFITSVSWNEAHPNVIYTSRSAAEANAHLIAAAPDLLASLESVLAFLEPDSLLDQAHDERLRIDAENAIVRAREIVVKAKGAA